MFLFVAQDGEPLTVIPKVNLIRLNKRHGNVTDTPCRINIKYKHIQNTC